MTAWLLKAFSGERPRISANLLPPFAAREAMNVRLDDGALTPLRAPQHVYSFPEYPGGYKTIYRHGDDWLGWTSIVHAAPGPVAADRLYYTGDGAPKMRADGEVYDLAVPLPGGALTGTPSGSGDGDVVTRVYVYTYVTSFGEESEPSPASDPVDWQPGQTVTLSGFEEVPEGRSITKQRIYRTQTGESGTDLYFIAERNASDGNFTDDIDVDAFGEVLPSRAYNVPPDGLTGLVAMPNGMMAAFSGKSLYFCEPWLPHAWPDAYVLTTDFPIVALGAIGTSLVVMTDGNPYLVQGTDPASMQMVKIETNLPCINARGVQDLGYGIAYPSHEGLVLVSASGEARIATEQLFGVTDWQRFNPVTMCAGQLSGRYLASYNSTDADGNPLVGLLTIQTGIDSAFVVRSDLQAYAFFYDVTEGALYFLDEDGAVNRFDPPSGVPNDLYWRSRPMLLSSAENFGAIRIDGEAEPTAEELANIETARQAIIAANASLIENPLGSEICGTYIGVYTLAGDPLEQLPGDARSITVNVYADGVVVATISNVGVAKRLPAGFRARKWEIAVFGTTRVQQIVMASTMAELRAVGAQ